MLIEKDITEIAQDDYYKYALKTISDRAIPHLYDGLKPVQRRILYSMFISGPRSNQGFKKSARIVGEVLGKFHPHSDGSVYGALVNMTEEYSKYPYVSGQGNFGSRSEDPPAAMRYTEVRLNKIAEDLLLYDLSSKCVRFKDNYDQTEKEPIYLPARVPTVLINYDMGLAVSLRSSIISHNIREVIDLVLLALENKEEEAFEYYKGPDFNSEVLVYIDPEVKRDIFYSGKGSIKLYAKLEIKEKKNETLVKVWSIPFNVSRKKILDQLINLKKNYKLEFMTYSKEDKPKIEIRFKSRISKEEVEKILYNKTGLRSSFSIELMVLDGVKPVQIGIWPLIVRWLEYRKEVLINKFKYELAIVNNDILFYSALMKVYDRLNEFLDILRYKGVQKAKEFLAGLDIDNDVINRILSIRITAFAEENIIKSKEKLEELNRKKDYYEKLISDRLELENYIRRELEEIKNNYSDRKSVILLEDLNGVKKVTKLARKVSVVGSRLVLDSSGQLYDYDQKFFIFGSKGLVQFRLGDLNRLREKASVDINMLVKLFSNNRMNDYFDIDLRNDYAFVLAKKFSYFVNMKKARSSLVGKKFREFEEKNLILKIYYFNDNDLDNVIAVCIGKRRIKAFYLRDIFGFNSVVKKSFSINIKDVIFIDKREYENIDNIEFLVKREKHFNIKVGLEELFKGLKYSAELVLLEGKEEGGRRKGEEDIREVESVNF